jgi:hypothetical protein
VECLSGRAKLDTFMRCFMALMVASLSVGKVFLWKELPRKHLKINQSKNGHWWELELAGGGRK